VEGEAAAVKVESAEEAEVKVNGGAAETEETPKKKKKKVRHNLPLDAVLEVSRLSRRGSLPLVCHIQRNSAYCWLPSMIERCETVIAERCPIPLCLLIK